MQILQIPAREKVFKCKLCVPKTMHLNTWEILYFL